MKILLYVSHNKNQQGFTLIEIVASITILSIILTAFFSFFSQSLLFSQINGNKISAYNIARDYVEVATKRYDYKINKNAPPPQLINCDNYNDAYVFGTLVGTAYERSCPYSINNNYYYPEIKITKENYNINNNSLKFHLYLIHVQVYDSNNSSERKLLSESFNYVRECIYRESDPNVCK